MGTGAGGGTTMKILCEAGLKVCAINSGPRTNPAKDYRRHRHVYDLKYRGYGNPLRLEGRAHQEPYSVEESEYSEGSDLFEHDVAYSNEPGTDWYWKRCKGTGGKANFWGRSSARFGDIDFKAADLDGFGENWPVDYAEISAWFSKAERYMGVASTIQNRPSNPDGEYLPPMPWRCLDYIIQKGGEKIGVPYLPDRCAQKALIQGERILPMRKLLTPLLLSSLLLALALPPVAAAQAAADTYKAKCAGCHGPDGGGKPAMKTKDLGSSDIQKMSDADLTAMIANGKGTMPAYKGKMTDAQISDMVKYIRTLKK